MLEKVTRDCRISILEDVQHSARQGPGQPDLITPATEQRTDHLKAFLPTSVCMILMLRCYRILWACFLLAHSLHNSHWLDPPGIKTVRNRQAAALTSFSYSSSQMPQDHKISPKHFMSCGILISIKLRSPALLWTFSRFGQCGDCSQLTFSLPWVAKGRNVHHPETALKLLRFHHMLRADST